MLYKSQKYKDVVDSTFPDEIRKNLEMLKRISANFTTDNTAAHEIDERLIIAIEMHMGNNSQASTSLLRQFDELLRNLKSGFPNPEAAPLNVKEIEKIIAAEMSRQKIGVDNLSAELRKLISETREISYNMPDHDKTKPAVPSKLRPISIKIVDDLIIGNNVMLIGNAGTGKTFLAKQIANNVWGKSPKVINCSQWTSPTEIIGGYTVEGYQEGKLIEAYRDGHILILDEMPKLDPNTAGLLNDALSNTRETGKESMIQSAKGDTIEKHKMFACIATGNVYPNSTSIAYAANNKQDLSLLDRFSGSLYFLEKDEKFEQKRIEIPFIWNCADAIRNVIEENKWEAQISLRWMIGARNVFVREWERQHGKRKDNLKANEGLTFADFLDKFLATFTAEQIALLKNKIDYDSVKAEYRKNLAADQYTVYNIK